MKRPLVISFLVLLAFVGSARANQDVIATLTAYDGMLDVVRTGISLSLYPEMPLLSGDVVHTRDGRATIRFQDQSEMRLRAHTRLAVSERRERRDVEVFFGRLWAFVARQKDRQTAFKTGGTIAAVRGTRIEYAALLNGQVDVGVVEGLVELFHTRPDGGTASRMVGAGFRVRVASDGTTSQSPFRVGEIFGGEAGPDGAAVPPPAAEIETARSEPEAAAAPVAAAVAPPPAAAVVPEPEPAAAEPAAEPEPAAAPEAVPATASESEEEQPPTQGEYAIKLLNALGIAQYLPPNSTARDAMEYLARLGLLPCSGEWEDAKIIDLNDLLCIAGIDPNDPNAPLTISQEELIAKILERYGELFWLQARWKQTVSPFAP